MAHRMTTYRRADGEPKENGSPRYHLDDPTTVITLTCGHIRTAYVQAVESGAGAWWCSQCHDYREIDAAGAPDPGTGATQDQED